MIIDAEMIKPVSKWAKLLGVRGETLRKWLTEDCQLQFNTLRQGRCTLIRGYYIQRVLDKHEARPGKSPLEISRESRERARRNTALVVARGNGFPRDDSRTAG